MPHVKKNKLKEEKANGYFDLNSINTEFKVLLESIIRKCLRFEACSRPSSLELLLEIHEYMKISNSKGIFTEYNMPSVSDKIKSIKKLRFEP